MVAKDSDSARLFYQKAFHLDVHMDHEGNNIGIRDRRITVDAVIFLFYRFWVQKSWF